MLSKEGKERIDMEDTVVIKMPRNRKNLLEQKGERTRMKALSLDN